MAEAIPGVNVQALTAFFSKRIEPSKANTQPRRKIQKNKAFSKLLEFSSKPDLTVYKNSNSSYFPRSVSAFDLSNAGTLPYTAKKCDIPSKGRQSSNQTSVTSVPIASTVLNDSTHASAILCQDISYTLDTVSNDSGVEENSESYASGDSRHSFNALRNSAILNCNVPIQNSLSSESSSETSSQRSPTVNIVIKNPFLENNKHAQSEVINTNRRNVITTVWNRTYEVDVSNEIEKNLINKPLPDKVFYSEIVISDNYICKAQYKRTELPSPELLGPPPYKPKKLDNVRLLSLPTSKGQQLQKQTIPPRLGRELVREAYSPSTQHINKPRSESALSKTSFAQDISCNEYRQRTTSDITSNNSHSYQQQKYFCDDRIPVSRPPSLPPRRLSCPSQFPEKDTLILFDIPGEELYQDAEIEDDNPYEEVPSPSNSQSHLYVNHTKPDDTMLIPDKMSREISKLLQRERVRQERELEKLKKKFGITGEEVPLDKGYIKNDAKGGRGDLAVKKGEAVMIMRIEDNPIGRLLVQNERKKIGYVALNNLTVDADSVKIVMRKGKYSMGNKEGRYSNNSSSGEAIYEEC